MDVRVWPHKPGDGGICCMPLVRNVPTPRSDWKETTCPRCGSPCWESDQARSVKQSEGLQCLCTECALRTAMNTNGGQNGGTITSHDGK